MSDQLKAILEQIEALDELKQATLKSYISKAVDDMKHLDVAAKRAGAAEDDEMESALQDKKEKRETGIASANSRTFGKKEVDESLEDESGLENIIEQIDSLDEASKKELAACMDDEDDEEKEEEDPNKKSPVRESVEALVSAILDGGDATQAFNIAMAEKVTGVMDAMKVDIASQLTK